MAARDPSEPESNANKENENQGNSEKIVIENKQESESDSDIDSYQKHLLNKNEFDKKYLKLQQLWLDGMAKTAKTNNNNNNNDNDNDNDNDDDMNNKNKHGKHEYLTQYILPKDQILASQITYHPSYAYTYTSHEKEKILPSMTMTELNETKERFESHINRLEKKILTKIRKQQIKLDGREEKEKKEEEEKLQKRGWQVPEYCVPIRTDIRQFDFKELARKQKELSGRLFDVIMMDPPWQLASANPTRGVAIGYSQLDDDIISSLPIEILQTNGFLFVWVINAKYRLALHLFKKWGYKMIGDVAWVKQTVNRRIANGHGFYLQHAKETCLIGLKGDIKKIKYTKGCCSDVIYSERRGQSQKPEEIYQYIEKLIPKGYYMEIFARRNNLRNGWFSIGNEL